MDNCPGRTDSGYAVEAAEPPVGGEVVGVGFRSWEVFRFRSHIHNRWRPHRTRQPVGGHYPVYSLVARLLNRVNSSSTIEYRDSREGVTGRYRRVYRKVKL